MSETPPTKLYPALLAAMRACGPVRKNAVNPHLKSKYADLTSVLDTIEQPLWDNGLLIVQRFTHDQGGAILVTELIHAASGERIASEVPVVSKDPTDPQKIGAAITYYRRYSLLALLGLAPEDDDGHAAAQPVPPPRPQTARQGPPAIDADGVLLRTTPPAPSPAAVPQGGGPPPPAPEPPYTDREFNAIIDKAWEWAEDGWTLEDIRNDLNKLRHRMSKQQRKESLAALEKIEERRYPAPAAIAG